jgi:hypothetical protein
MRIVLLGATGFVGSALLVEALHRGHKVTAIVRHPEKLEKRDGLTATAGDVYDTDSLASLIAGHHALISAFNPGWTPGTVKPEMYDEQVRGTSSIIAAARKAGIKRVLWVGGAGGLEVAPGVQSIDAPGFPEWIKPGSSVSSAFCEAGARATNREIPTRRRPAPSRCQWREQNFSSGLCGSDDRRAGATSAYSPAFHSRILNPWFAATPNSSRLGSPALYDVVYGLPGTYAGGRNRANTVSWNRS